MTDIARVPLPTLEDTEQLAVALATHLEPPMTIGLIGTLGAGKTQLVRSLANALGVSDEYVTSPTYVLMQTYRGRCVIHHFDFYRLESSSQVWDLGIDELYEEPCLVLIEWSDKFPECLPKDVLSIAIRFCDSGDREALISGSGPRSCALVARLH